MNEPTELPVRTPRVWLHYAQGDLGVALREAEYETPTHFTICFLCQGAAEKFLKAYLISQGWELIRTHDIVELLEYCCDYDPDFGGLMENGRVLNEYIVAGRYPGDVIFEEIGPDETREALQAACQIRDAVVARLA